MTETAHPLREPVIDALRECFDPEIPVNIYELGLIYEILIDDDNKVDIKMTLTSPACPVAGTLPGEVQALADKVEGTADVNVELVWDPPWTQAMLSEAAKLQLGLM